MCSVNDDSELIPPEPQQPNPSLCKKCASTAVVTTEVKHAYCRDCFIALVTHKFRAVLGKSKLMNIKDHVLAIHMGTASSSAMLHLLKLGISETSHKRFLFSASVLYLDEGAVQGKSREDRKADLMAAASFISSLNFNAHFAKIEDVLDCDKETTCLPLDSYTDLSINNELVEEFQHLLNNASSLTAKDDLLRCLRHKLILKASKELKATKVFVDLCGTDLAISIMSNVALGRGAHLQHNVGFCDARDPSIKILRPMRDISRKEIAYYNNYHNIQATIVSDINTKAGAYASIQNLSEKFILDLQENFPSTVSTVFRTGEKLGGTKGKGLESEEDRCALCDGSLDTRTEICSSLEATKFSRTVSSLGPKGFDNMTMEPTVSDKNTHDSPAETCACRSSLDDTTKDDEKCKTSTKVKMPKRNMILSSFCYGCQLIYKDMESPALLPPHVLTAVYERSNLRKMRHSVQDFLL